MKRFFLLGLFYFLTVQAFSKKDPEAWKAEKTIETQYSSFKSNISSWDGYLMAKEPQLNELHKSLRDSISKLEKTITEERTAKVASGKEVGSLEKLLKNTQNQLDESLKKENELTTLGMQVDKNSFPTLLYTFIILVIIVAIIGFGLFFRSNAVTKETEKRYAELSDEFQQHKSKAMERETKLRRELQTERNKNYAT